VCEKVALQRRVGELERELQGVYDLLDGIDPADVRTLRAELAEMRALYYSTLTVDVENAMPND
jgi:hypothetical protein